MMYPKSVYAKAEGELVTIFAPLTKHQLDDGDHQPLLSLTEEQAKKLRNHLNASLSRIERRRSDRLRFTSTRV